MKVALFLCLAAAIYTAVSDELPKRDTIIEFARKLGFPALASAGFFMTGSVTFMSPIAGVFLAGLGWFLARVFERYMSTRKTRQISKQIKDFVTSATSLYMANSTTPEVINTASTYLADPLSSELQNMLLQRNLKNIGFSAQFHNLFQKYKVPEFDAISKIIGAGEMTGGSRSIAGGLSRLGDAMRRRERMQAEHRRSTMEPALGAGLAVLVLIIAAISDATAFRSVFEQSPLLRIALSVGVGIICGLITLMLILMRK